MGNEFSHGGGSAHFRFSRLSPSSLSAPPHNARTAWNTATNTAAGFNVFQDAAGAVTLNAGADTGFCGFLSDGVSPAHGCPDEDFDYSVPLGVLYFYAPAFSNNAHRQSDIMHEFGHILYNAAEHYTGVNSNFNCSSIMGHCNSAVLTTVQDHDKTDFSEAFRLKDAPDAAYAQQPSAGTIRHYFEGSYFGGAGRTLHAEKQYVIDRSTNGVNGTYGPYETVPRRADNSDDGTPNSADFSAVPSAGAEWCFKIRGETGAISNTASSFRWSPRSRAYCVASLDQGRVYAFTAIGMTTSLSGYTTTQELK